LPFRRIVVGSDQKRERVDKLLARLIPDASRAMLQRWIAEGRVLVDGERCRARALVGPGSVLDVDPAPPPPSRAEPDASVPFVVVHEDAHLLVVEKPAGVVVHPARGHAHGTLVSGLLARPGFGRAAADPLDAQAAIRPGIVHRLDKDTSGLLVVARDAPTREGLKAQLAAHSVERVYRALTLGVPRAGVLRTAHARHPRSRLRFTSRVKSGKPAVTHVAVLERLAAGEAAFVECRLETGRTHQIRVHLSEQTRTPVLGDELYGGVPKHGPLAAVARELGRQALHAAVLGFVHPVTGRTLRFESPLPADMANALQALRLLSERVPADR
jgi:23S rRNA pseudouridine1911/1915/1917 synthase